MTFSTFMIKVSQDSIPILPYPSRNYFCPMNNFTFCVYLSKQGANLQNRYISMYQPLQGRKHGHLVPIVAGTYNLAILDMKTNIKLTKNEL